MRQLNKHDALFLASESAHSNSNVSLIQIYDPSTAPGGRLRFKSVLALVESRLHRSPIFRQKLRQVPFGLDDPYWIDDENFDLEYHVRNIALPKPGDWRQFCIQASRIHARPLDLDRPPWEIYVIEGLDSLLDLPKDSFALLTKLHHAAIDVEQGTEIITLLHDTTPHPPKAEPPAPWFPESPPNDLELACRGVMHTATSPLRLARPIVNAFARVVPTARAFASELLQRQEAIPVTRFNTVVSPYRVFETRRFLLDEFREIRRLVPGATINDAVLAVCAGGLRSYLEANDELPEQDLSTMTPVYVPDADGKPQVEWVNLGLGVTIADPVRRLAFVKAQTAASELMSRAIGARELTDLGTHAPAATLALTGKMLGRALLGAGRRAPLANCAITNVPGPTVPLYLDGARMTYFSAIMPINDGLGLVFAITSYDGKIIVSPTSCREQMPDPEVFAQCVRDCFQDYVAIARARTRARTKATPRQGTRAARTPRSAGGTAAR
jgi:diacylglycerol O-acyltransferase / wax synthase